MHNAPIDQSKALNRLPPQVLEYRERHFRIMLKFQCAHSVFPGMVAHIPSECCYCGTRRFAHQGRVFGSDINRLCLK